MNADSEGRGAHLSAFLAGDLDADERAALEAELARDPGLQAQLARVRAAADALDRLPEPTPPEGMRDRILAATAHEVARRRPDELAARRERRARTLRPLAVAAAAAAVIGVVGVGAGYVLGGGAGGADSGAETAAEGGALDTMAQRATGPAAPEVNVVETANDFDAQELNRLAVGVDTSEILRPGLTADEAAPLSDRLLGQLLTFGSDADVAAGMAAEQEGQGDDEEFAEDAPAPADAEQPAVARCLAPLVEEADGPLVPVYVEIAKFEGEPAVIYALATLEPNSGEFRRIQVWAVAQSDCHVLQFAQYDRPG